MGDGFAVLLLLGGQPQHEIELHFAPSAPERLPRAVKDHFLGKALVDHIAHPLGSCLRREGEAALAHILHPAHHIQ